MAEEIMHAQPLKAFGLQSIHLNSYDFSKFPLSVQEAMHDVLAIAAKGQKTDAAKPNQSQFWWGKTLLCCRL